MAIQWAALGIAAAIVIFFGVYGYFVESLVRIGFSVYQVLAVLGAIFVVMAIDIPMFKGARSTGTDPLGHDRAALAVRVDPARGDLHLADGADGLRPVGHPPALARLRRHARQLGRRGHARDRIRGQHDHGGHHRVLRCSCCSSSGSADSARRARPRRTATRRRSSPAAATPRRSREGRTLCLNASSGRGEGRCVRAGRDGQLHVLRELDSADPVEAAAELSLEGGNVTPAQLVKAGEEIFHTKGTCEICHRIGQKGTRAPDLAGIGSRAAKTKPGMSAKQYIIESLLQPGAYLVEGYPNIMPQVDKPPIALNRSEVWALTAFLESLGGTAERHARRHPEDRGRVGRRRRAGRDQAPGRPEGGRSRVQRQRPPASRATRRARSAPRRSVPISRRSRRSRRPTTS